MMLLLLAMMSLGCALGDGGDVAVVLRNGVRMPVLSAGTWQYNDTVAAEAVAAALGVGFRHIDTALDYGNQQGVSVGLKQSGVARKDIFLTTKIPGCGAQGIRSGKCAEDSAAALATDFEELSTEYIDLVLLHFPACVTEEDCRVARSGCSAANCEAARLQWRVLEDAYDAGKLRAIGVSNYCSSCLDCLDQERVQPMVNQVQYHIGMGKDPQGFLQMDAHRGIVTQAWSPLGAGGHGDDQILSGNLTKSIAKRHNKSTAQIALKYILTNKVAVATKSANPVHLAEDLQLFDFELSREEMDSLDDANFASDDTPSFMCDNNIVNAPEPTVA